MVAAKIANMKRGDNQHKKEDGAIAPCSQESAAGMLNVSRDSVKRAKRVIDKGAPAVVAAVESDKLARDLEAILRPKAREQQVASLKKGSAVPANLPKRDALDTRLEAILGPKAKSNQGTRSDLSANLPERKTVGKFASSFKDRHPQGSRQGGGLAARLQTVCTCGTADWTWIWRIEAGG